MKLRIIIAAFAISIPCCQTGCMTKVTRTITTDKNGTVTDSTVTEKGTDETALKLVGMAVELYRPRPAVIVREEKADHDMKRLLKGRPITREEIALRWKPLP